MRVDGQDAEDPGDSKDGKEDGDRLDGESGTRTETEGRLVGTRGHMDTQRDTLTHLTALASP